MPDRNFSIIIAGPTASGKSALAIAVAEAIGGEIVNADSMQVYRELRVLTARPSAADEARRPHHLFGVLSVTDKGSVGDWLTRATAVAAVVHAAGRTPVFVGGTGLYLKALLEGLAPVPEVPEAAIVEATALYDELGGEAFRIQLLARDPEAAGISAGDRQRLLRAHQVVVATGHPLSHWRGRQPATPPLSGAFLKLLLLPPRDALYAAIDARFRAMVEAGGLEEAETVAAMALDPSLPASRAVGLRQLAGYLAGETSKDEAIEAAAQATRNYAKRQFTWFRNQFAADHVWEDFATQTVIDEAVAKAVEARNIIS